MLNSKSNITRNPDTEGQDRRYKLFNLKNIPAPNFLMTVLELKDFIDFEVKRVYFMKDPTGDKVTGSHSHIQEEDELFALVSGICTIVVDDGHGLEEIKLTGPKQAIFIPTMVWHHFKDLSNDCIILALSSTNYDPSRKDYCESHEEFQQLLKEKELDQNED